MKFEIYGQHKDKDSVKLRLEEYGDGSVALTTVGEKGYADWYLAILQPDGTMALCEGVGDERLSRCPNERIRIG